MAQKRVPPRVPVRIDEQGIILERDGANGDVLVQCKHALLELNDMVCVDTRALGEDEQRLCGVRGEVVVVDVVFVFVVVVVVGGVRKGVVSPEWGRWEGAGGGQ